MRTFTTADGLLRDQVACVRSDPRGFVWFCTADALVRFDGQVAVTFGRDEVTRDRPWSKWRGGGESRFRTPRLREVTRRD